MRVIIAAYRQNATTLTRKMANNDKVIIR